MAVEQHTTSRRGLLGALAVAPLIAAPAIGAAAPTSELLTLVGRWRAAVKALMAHEATHFSPAKAAYDAACAKVPHVTTKATYLSNSGARRISTADAAAVGAARSHMRWMGGERHEAYLVVCREVIAADDAREAEMNRLKDRYRVDELWLRNTELERATDRAFDAVLAYEIANPVDLLAKIAVLEEVGEFDREPSGRALCADVRRVLKGGLN